jgi:chloramphenicol-sensitive protein RarD
VVRGARHRRARALERGHQRAAGRQRADHALPLALFAYGARLIPYSTIGIVQYIGPTLQLLIGVLVFHEAFPWTRAIGFAFIWAALAVYAADSLWRSRK